MTDQIMGVSMETVSFFSRYRTAHWTEALAIVIIAALLISNPILRRSRQPEDRMFRKLCYVGLFFSLICLLQVFTGEKELASITWNSLRGHLIERGPDLINLLYTFVLLLFVDLAAYHSVGAVKRRYILYVIPFVTVFILWGFEFVIKQDYVNHTGDLINLGYVYLVVKGVKCSIRSGTCASGGFKPGLYIEGCAIISHQGASVWRKQNITASR